jgi:hypothetical protein
MSTGRNFNKNTTYYLFLHLRTELLSTLKWPTILMKPLDTGRRDKIKLAKLTFAGHSSQAV